LDLFNFFADAPPTRAYCTGGHALGAEQPDYLACAVDYQNGVRALLGLTVIAAARNEIRLEVIGSEGRIEAEIIGGSIALWRRQSAEPEEYSPPRPADYRFHGFPGALEALQDFARCAREGREPLVGMDAAEAATAVCTAGEASLGAGAAIAVETGFSP